MAIGHAKVVGITGKLIFRALVLAYSVVGIVRVRKIGVVDTISVV